MIRALIFDIGNVLVHFDYQLACQRLRPDWAECGAAIWPAVEAVKNRYERGEIKRAEFPGQVRAVLAYAGSEAEFIEAWEQIFTVNEPMIALVQALRGRYDLYLLSNISDLHVDYLIRAYPFFAWFRDAAYSYRIGALKPEPLIYTHAIAQFGVCPGEAVFIDDLAANVVAARAAGLRAIHYERRDHGALLRALRELGVEVPG